MRHDRVGSDATGSTARAVLPASLPVPRPTMTSDDPREAERLEELWRGSFGDDYVERNQEFEFRRPFWRDLIGAHPCDRVLEVGCNVGGNLRWIAELITAGRAVGVDVNGKALRQLQGIVPGVNAVWGAARQLPFRDAAFDLVFTMGVLIHQPDATLPVVMSEIVRASRRWVLCGEYFAERTTEVAYRGQDGALFKRDYGSLYARLFPVLRSVDTGFLGRDAGWDDVTWWLFEKRPAGGRHVDAPR
jgi:pseudaminic acid biosynthesis-associated methylase